MPQKGHGKDVLKLLSVLPVRYISATAVIFIITSTCTRIFILINFYEDFTFSVKDIAETFASGFVNDSATLIFILLPMAFFLFVLLPKVFLKKSGSVAVIALIFFFAATVIFSSCAEFLFWDEFHSRFNFIAVDYLIYTSEVINNIRESYSLLPVFSGIFLISCLITAVAWRWITQVQQIKPIAFTSRIGFITGNALLVALIFFFFTPLTGGSNRYWQEASHNGIYELFSAYRHNTIDYRAFYPLMEKEEAFSLMRKELAEPASSFLAPYAEDLRRDIANSSAQKSFPNVIIVIMESMGSKWLGEYTPNLTRLAEQGLFFSAMQSTGTRTVRGLEAITLSTPPTPGNSIVRRPNNSGLFSIGSVFSEHGYDRTFIYGGYGYFDNMNSFFAGNGYRVLDRTDFPPAYKTFATAWGQCDEDLFNVSLAEADASHAAGRPFHQVVLTTSNHRPFTYPEGKVDIPSGSGRSGAVKYADYSIGCFLKAAESKSWFSDTVFIFIGDHPSSIAGKTEVPADKYGVVSIIYAPRLITPKKVETLCSQIDLAPTLFALLGWEYRSQFFGKNILTMPPDKGRAWISTYQLLGFLDQNGLTVLRPVGKTDANSNQAAEYSPNSLDENRKTLAIASYQCAYDLFSQGRMAEQAVRSNPPK